MDIILLHTFQSVVMQIIKGVEKIQHIHSAEAYKPFTEDTLITSFSTPLSPTKAILNLFIPLVFQQTFANDGWRCHWGIINYPTPSLPLLTLWMEGFMCFGWVFILCFCVRDWKFFDGSDQINGLKSTAVRILNSA